MAGVSVYLEVGARRSFACAVEWPGWARSARTEGAALAALAGYAPRFALVARRAGLSLEDSFDVTDPDPAGLFVVEEVAGSATTDVGAPGALISLDAVPRSAQAAERDTLLLTAAWSYLAQAAAAAPQSLRKGPRGGGRDRDAVLEHVRATEVVYAGKLGLRLRGAGLDDADEDATRRARDLVLDRLRAAAPPATASGWPTGYAARRFAWHVLDHAWEIEDRH